MGSTKRRAFLKQSLGVVLASTFYSGAIAGVNDDERKTIILRAGWDNQDAGSIADIPAIYRLIQKYVPNTEVIIWPFEINDEILEFLNKNFTNLQIVSGVIDENNNPSSEELEDALTKADLFIYSTGVKNEVNWTGENGSGIETTSLKYIKKASIPYIIVGTGNIPEKGKEFDMFFELCESSEMVVITDSKTENILKDQKIKLSKSKRMPHFLLAYELKDDIAVRKVLEGLELDKTDFLTISFSVKGMEEASINGYIEKLKYMVTSWIDNSDSPVLFVGHEESDAPILQSKILDSITDDKKSKVKILSGFMLPDIEISIYEKARIVTGNRATQVIFGIQSKTPVYYFTDWSLSYDGQNSLDLGLKDYVINLSEDSKEDLAEGLLKISKNYVKAILDTSKARDTAYQKIALGMADINKIVNKSKKEKKKQAKKAGKQEKE